MKKTFLTLAFTFCFGFLSSCKNETIPEKSTLNSIKEAINPEDLTTLSLKIDGMTCEIGCAKLIESKLLETDGVADAKVSFETKMATIQFNKKIQSKTKLAERIEKIGGGDLYRVVK
jgi:mercuric ion binding protein